jgi:NAD(P)H-dependent flavin oxidoreductase YrpB (nitropropane dioxygenase family)
MQGRRCKNINFFIKGFAMNKSTSLPDLVIGGLHINPPIIQGGMGVLVSSSKLAAAVSNEGALGVIAAVGTGEEGCSKNMSYQERSFWGLRETLKKARMLSSKPIAVNVMCALSNYEDLVRAAVAEKASAIISGAGLPLKLPGLVKSSKIKLIPVVSSVRAASIICRTWWKKYKRLPDALVVEGPSAGGHLGFSMVEMAKPPVLLETIVGDVLELVKTIKNEHNFNIPIIAAGGIFTGNDIAHFLKLGAAGVQMGTRFVCTDECDASILYKQAYLDCNKEDIIIIESPVKLPLRVIRNAFVDRLRNGGKQTFRCNYHCLKNCIPANSPYCIAQALKNASEGKMSEGFVTCGSNAYRIKNITSVKKLITELVNECLHSIALTKAKVNDQQTQWLKATSIQGV